MGKKFLFCILIVFLVCIVGCGKENNNDKKSDVVSDSSQLPDIVFLNVIDYVEIPEGESPQYAITFYDKNGDHYISTDKYVCTLYFDQLVEEYAEGTLSDKISYHTSCDMDELLENYNKLCELSNDDIHIVYPEYGPDVLANRETWYGLYYDKDGKIQALKLHEKDEHGDHETDDERANEIYRWYITSFENEHKKTVRSTIEKIRSKAGMA